MRPIPPAHRKIIDSDPYYRKCCLTGETAGKIDLHHSFEYKGSQISELWAYMPIISRKHSPQGDADSVHRCKVTMEKVQYLSLLRATEADLKKYPKKNWKQLFSYLSKKYGV